MNKLEQCAHDGNLEGLVHELNTPKPCHTKTYIATRGNKAICLATQNGHVACVEALLNAQCVSNSKIYEAICAAAGNGHVDALKSLSVFYDPNDGVVGSYPLYSASCAGHIECVKFLLPLSDPLLNSSSALVAAARNGHTECVALLVDVSNPHVNCSKPLCEAVKGRHSDVVQLLLGKSNLEVACAVLPRDDVVYLNTQIAVYEKQMIENALETLPSLHVRRKM